MDLTKERDLPPRPPPYPAALFPPNPFFFPLAYFHHSPLAATAASSLGLKAAGSTGAPALSAQAANYRRPWLEGHSPYSSFPLFIPQSK